MESLVPDAIWTFDTPYTGPDPLADGEIWEDEHGNEICRIEYTPEILEKHCKDCGRLIAVRDPKKPPHRGGRWNRVQYCQECAEARTARNKAMWQRQNRRDCRIVNRELKRELATARKLRAALEERLEQVKGENEQNRLVEPRKKERTGLISLLLGGA